MTKKCNKCEKIKNLSEFYKNKSHKKDGFSTICKECDNKRYKKHYDLMSPEVRKNRQLMCDCKITFNQYNEMLIRQNHKCLGCYKDEVEIGTLCVDYNHDTGKIRGLLCRRCNFILGYAHDNPNTLSNLIKYLKKYK